jgi:uncharacterized protein YkwD
MKKYFKILLLLFLFSCSPDDNTTYEVFTYPQYSVDEQDLILKINNFRLLDPNNLNVLIVHEHMSGLCKRNNDAMISANEPGHYNFEYTTSSIKHLGYNKVSQMIAYNFQTNQSILNALQNDPTCLTILKGDFTHIGLSKTLVNNKMYCTIIFAK